MIQQVVITDAWFKHEGQYVLNPALKAYEQSLLSMKQQWQTSEPLTPLSWYAKEFTSGSSAALIAALIPKASEKAEQYWVVSPYHARLTRSTLRVMPDSMLDWSDKEARQVCTLLNPLLKQDGMELHEVNSVLLLTCDRVWDVAPQEFASVSGSLLPDRPPSGRDAGLWMRLLSEVQMTLHQHPVVTASGIPIHGLWFWGKSDVQAEVKLDNLARVATRDIYLKSVLSQLGKDQDASVIVTEAEHLPMLLHDKFKLPSHWLLLGAGKSVKLTNNMIQACLAKVRAQKWKGTE